MVSSPELALPAPVPLSPSPPIEPAADDDFPAAFSGSRGFSGADDAASELGKPVSFASLGDAAAPDFAACSGQPGFSGAGDDAASDLSSASLPCLSGFVASPGSPALSLYVLQLRQRLQNLLNVLYASSWAFWPQALPLSLSPVSALRGQIAR